MMRVRFLPLSVALISLLAACGGDGSGGSGGFTGTSPTSTPGTSTPAPTTASCSLSSRKQWVLGQLNEWYLFPTLLNTSVNAGSYGDVQSYIDALVAPARAQSKDRYFTYITSIAEENAYYDSGASAGLGVRLSFDGSNGQLFVAEAFEGAPALAAGLDRGTEIVAIGTSANSLQTVSGLYASGGSAALNDALGPNDVGVTRVFQIRDDAGTRTVTVTKTEYEIDPVSPRYGAKVIDDGGKKVGYVNLRNFIGPADPQLRAAFDMFRKQAVTNVVVDLRYNGGGLISIAELMGDLMAANRVGQIFSYTTFRDSKAENNESYAIRSRSEAITAMKIAFIGQSGTASASELVINGFVPYLGTNMALVGGNTYGKPVGQIGLDQPSCDDRLRVIALKVENSQHDGEYFTGLANTVPVTCRASDDIDYQLGDPREAMLSTALDFLDGRSCSPIAGSGQGAQSLRQARRALQPEVPVSTAQRETPGLY